MPDWTGIVAGAGTLIYGIMMVVDWKNAAEYIDSHSLNRIECLTAKKMRIPIGVILIISGLMGVILSALGRK